MTTDMELLEIVLGLGLALIVGLIVVVLRR